MVSDVIRQVSAGHPFRDKLEWSRGDTEQRDDVFMFQVFPYYCLLVESLRVSSATMDRKVMESMAYFCGFLGAIPGVDSNTLDANL